MPLGAQNSLLVNFLFVIVILGVILGALFAIVHFYPRILPWCLANKWKFLAIPIFSIGLGITIWQGFDKLFGFVAGSTERSEEHTSELQSLMRISYAVFCLKKKKKVQHTR